MVSIFNSMDSLRSSFFGKMFMKTPPLKNMLAGSSVSDPELDPHSMAAWIWIRIRIPNAVPEPGGLKRTTMKGKNSQKPDNKA
jgi:hypothetical protein